MRARFSCLPVCPVSNPQLGGGRPGLGREHHRSGDRPERRRAPRRDGDGHQSGLAGAAGDGRHERAWASTAWRRYRLGSIEVAFELSGFRPVQRQNVRLTVGFTARIDVALGLATVAETVTVSGAAPVVDVTATSGSTLLTKEIARAHAHEPQWGDEPVDPGARRAQLARCRGQPDWWRTRTRACSGRAARCGPRSRGLRRRPVRRRQRQPVGLPDDRRSARPEPRHRCGVPDARRSDQRHREVRRQRLPRRRDLGPDEPQFAEQQPRRRVEGRRASRPATSSRTQYDVGGDLGGRIIRNKLWFYGALRGALPRWIRC